ncbi:hypothetical protein PCL_09552 [Purpureocillium lilacinum]|uniref:Uncharacterized protein n=1 Tax=Purpureocillium lilacinum TaxID=33203 RepID=A0A2U3DQM0_PURLI|nr:hypothetical protein PCL_09552 [Purpureocillium lilacinum]
MRIGTVISSQWDVYWWCLDPLNHFPSLRTFYFRPRFRLDAPSEHTTHMAKKIAAANLVNLRHCSLSLSFHTHNDIPVEVQKRLQLSLLSRASVVSLTIRCAQHWILSEEQYWTFGHEAAHIHSVGQPGPCAGLGLTKFTNLRKLSLRWDGLLLSWLSGLLRLLRRLESFLFQVSLRYSASYPVADIPLDLALESVADTLRILNLEPVDISASPESWEDDFRLMEDVGCRWSTRGLEAFQQLETLGLPGSSFELHRNRTRSAGTEHFLNLPRSLTNFDLANAYLLSMEPIGGTSPFSEELHATNALTLDWMARKTLGEMCQAVSSWHRLRHITVQPSDDLNLDDIRQRLPPVHLERNAKQC